MKETNKSTSNEPKEEKTQEEKTTPMLLAASSLLAHAQDKSGVQKQIETTQEGLTAATTPKAKENLFLKENNCAALLSSIS